MRLKNSNLTSIFPTPFATFEFEDYQDLNRRIVDYVHDCERQSKVRSSRNDDTTNWGDGFQIQLFRENVEVINEFARHVKQAFARYMSAMGLGDIQAEIRTSAWIVLSRAGGYNAPHVHPHATFSSIYHVLVPPGKHNPQGCVEFINPLGSAALQSLGNQTEIVEPREGTLLFIPSYLMHGVHPFEGDGERISLNMDFTVIQGGARNPLAGIQRT